MSVNAKIKFATRMAFVFIALMMLACAVCVGDDAALGLSGAQQVWAVRIILYVLVAFALLGGAFSVRVAWLRKRLGG